MPRTDDNWFIKPGYASRTEVNFYEDSDTGSEVVWQPEVYDAAALLARTSGADVIIDIGCGRAAKLAAITDTPTIGVDIGANIDWCRAHYPNRVWIEHDLESALPLDLGRDFDRAVVVCADVIEHLLDPTQLLKLLQGYQRRNAIILISTPDRDKVRGTADRGPPANPAHVREWNRDEFEAMLKAYDFDPVAVGHTQERSDSPERNTILATAYPSETPMTASTEDRKAKKAKPAKADKAGADAPARPLPMAADPGELELLRARAEAFQRELETARSRLRADADMLIEARTEAARLQARYEVVKEAHDQRSSAVMDLERLRITLADAEHRISVKDAYVSELEASRNQAFQQAEVKARLADELARARDHALERLTALSAAVAESDMLKTQLAQRESEISELTANLQAREIELEALNANRSDASDQESQIAELSARLQARDQELGSFIAGREEAVDSDALEDARRDAADVAHRLRNLQSETRGDAVNAAQIQSRMAEMEASLEDARTDAADVAAKLRKLQSETRNDAVNAVQIQSRMAEMEASLEDARTDAADVADRLRKLQASTRTLAGEANRAVELEAELKALHDGLDTLLGDSRSPLSNMPALEQLRALIEDLEARHQQAEARTAEVVAELEQVRGEQADTHARADGLQTDLARLNAELTTLQTDLRTIPPALLSLLGDGARPLGEGPAIDQIRGLVDALTARFGEAQERGALELEIRQLKMRAAAAQAETLTLRDNAWRLGNRITDLEAGNGDLSQRLAVVQAESDDKQQTLSELPWRVIGAYRKARRFIPMPLLRMLAAMLPRRRHQPPAPPVRARDAVDA